MYAVSSSAAEKYKPARRSVTISTADVTLTSTLEPAKEG
jgi:hypothetical protein